MDDKFMATSTEKIQSVGFMQPVMFQCRWSYLNFFKTFDDRNIVR